MIGSPRTKTGRLLLAALVVAAARTGAAAAGAAVTPTPSPISAAFRAAPTDVPLAGPQDLIIERAGNLGFLRVPVDGFENLPLQQKILLYHLAQAAKAGEEIAFDQSHRQALDVKDLFERMLTHRRAVDPAVFPRLRGYFLHFWGNRGPYNAQNREKLRPDFTFDELRIAAQAARRDGAFEEGESALDDRLGSLRRLLFDPQYEPMLVDTAPDKDNVASSAVNFYEGVTQEEAEQSSEGKPYPIASRLSKENGVLREEAYRAGDPERGIPPGRYAPELSAVIAHLQEALPYVSGPRQEATLKHLIRFFRSGDPADFKEYNRAWTHDDSPVDAILGFVETYNDPLGRRPNFEGMISFKDPQFTSVMQAVAAESDYFEKIAPWDDAYKKETSVPITANAVTMVATAGDAGAKLTLGVNLPNDQDLRQTEGSKNIMIANAISASAGALGAKEVEEFAWDAHEIELQKKWWASSYRLHVSLHEAVGHASGKVSERVAAQEPATFLKEYYAALEEARAELFGLWGIADPRLAEKGLIESPEIIEQSYRSFVRGALLQLRNYPGAVKLTQAHARARSLIVNYLIAKGAVEVKDRGGKIYLHVADLQAMRRVSAELLGRLMTIKAEGDYPGAKELFSLYGDPIDAAWRDQVVARHKLLNVPTRLAPVNPRLDPVKDESGRIVDVSVHYPATMDEVVLPGRSR